MKENYIHIENMFLFLPDEKENSDGLLRQDKRRQLKIATRYLHKQNGGGGDLSAFVGLPWVVNASPKIQSVVCWSILDHEIVALHGDNGKTISLNKTASIVWLQLDSGLSVSSIADQIISRYSENSERVVEDILKLIYILRDKGFVAFDLLE